MKLVYTHGNMAVVHSTKNVLELHGIDCLVKNEFGNSMGAEFGIDNFAEVWVLNDDEYDQALVIIENEITNPEEQTPWHCEKCQEKNEGSFQICWNCQTERPLDNQRDSSAG